MGETMYRWTEAARKADYEPQKPHVWRRCTRQRPCPICGRPDWCGISEDGSAACCMRVMDGAKHEIDLPHGRAYIHHLQGQQPQAPRPRAALVHPATDFTIDFRAAIDRWQAATTKAQLANYAASLVVKPHSLELLGAAWCESRRCWAFPMRDASRAVIGIRYRSNSGKKWAAMGSRSGCFLPSMSSADELLICEGPTDTAAAISLGYWAIGRPSCSGGTAIIREFLANRKRCDVVVVRDNDAPGIAGAKSLADGLLSLARSVRIISAAPHKDLRQWLANGCTYDVLKLRIKNARYHLNAKLDQSAYPPA